MGGGFLFDPPEGEKMKRTYLLSIKNKEDKEVLKMQPFYSVQTLTNLLRAALETDFPEFSPKYKIQIIVLAGD